MKDFVQKIDNDQTSAGVVIADEYNSILSENEGAVRPFMTLDGNQNDQLVRSIDIASKAMFYGDVGSVNSVHLTRGATTDQIETLFDGMVVMFSPSFENTGSATLKVHALLAKSMKLGGLDLVAGVLVVGLKYIAVYSLVSDVFNINVMADNTLPSESVDINDFDASNSINGYQKLPSGLIIQWGRAALVADTILHVTLPVTFPNERFIGLATGNEIGAEVIDSVVSVQSISVGSIALYSHIAMNICFWMILGY